MALDHQMEVDLAREKKNFFAALTELVKAITKLVEEYKPDARS